MRPIITSIRPPFLSSERDGGRLTEAGCVGERGVRFGLSTAACAAAFWEHPAGSLQDAPLFGPNKSEEVVDALEESAVQRSLRSPQLPGQPVIYDHCTTHTLQYAAPTVPMYWRSAYCPSHPCGPPCIATVIHHPLACVSQARFSRAEAMVAVLWCVGAKRRAKSRRKSRKSQRK